MKNEVKEKLTQIGEHILTNSRNELYLSMRFLDIALNSLSYEMNLSTFFVGTDGVSILYHPRFLMERYENMPKDINRAYLHIIFHCIFRHMYDREERDEEYWNLSCDIAIEHIVDSLTYKSVARVVSDYREETYQMLYKELKVLTAEGIYKVLKEKEADYQTFVKMSTEFLVDDHRFWTAKKKENSKEASNEESKNKESKKKESNNEKSKSETDSNSKNETTSDNNKPDEKQLSVTQKDLKQIEKWKKVSDQMKTNLETFSRNNGNESGNLMKSLVIDNQERMDYRSFLRRFSYIKEDMQLDDDSFDYIYYHYGIEKYGNMPLIEALEYKEVKKVSEFVIAIDTSGSCSGSLIKNFLEHTYMILKNTESFTKKVRIHIILCDMEVKEDILIENLEDFQKIKNDFILKGFGGTDFRPVFTYVDELIEKRELRNLKGMIYFTDGFGTYPKKRPSYDVAFIFLKDDYTDVLVPPWAMKLVIASDEIKGND